MVGRQILDPWNSIVGFHKGSLGQEAVWNHDLGMSQSTHGACPSGCTAESIQTALDHEVQTKAANPRIQRTKGSSRS